MIKKKMYIVKMEVLAKDIKTALVTKGTIYEVSIADEKYQPVENKPVGFNKK